MTRITAANAADLKPIYTFGQGAIGPKPVVAIGRDDQMAVGGARGVFIYDDLRQSSAPQFYELTEVPGGAGHGVRNLLYSTDQATLFIGVGIDSKVIALNPTTGQWQVVADGKPLALSSDGQRLVIAHKRSVFIVNAQTFATIMHIDYEPIWPDDRSNDHPAGYFWASVIDAQFMEDDTGLLLLSQYHRKTSRPDLLAHYWRVDGPVPRMIALPRPLNHPREAPLVTEMGGQFYTVHDGYIYTPDGVVALEGVAVNELKLNLFEYYDLSASAGLFACLTFRKDEQAKRNWRGVGLWDLRTGGLLWEFVEEERYTWGPTPVRLGPDGARIALRDKVYDTGSGDLLTAPQSDRYTLLDAPDRLWHMRDDEQVDLYDAVRQRSLATVPPDLIEKLNAHAYPEHDTVLLQSRVRLQQRIVNLRLSDGGFVASYSAEPAPLWTQLALSPDGRHVALCDAKGGVLYETRIGLRVSLPHGWQPITPAFTPNGEALLFEKSTGTLQLYDLTTRRTLHRFQLETPRTNPVRTISPDGRYLIFGPGQQTLTLYDLTTGQALYKVPNFALAIFSPDSQVIATQVDIGYLKLIEVATGREIAQLGGAYDWRQQSGTEISSFSFNQRGALWLMLKGGEHNIYDPHTGEQLETPPRWVWLLENDGLRFYADQHNKRLLLCDTNDQIIAQYSVSTPIRKAALSADGERLLLQDSGAVTVWRVSE